MTLANKVCIPCQGGVAPLGPDAAANYLRETPGWTLGDNATRLRRRFEFADFRAAQAFVLRVGNLAESAGHHPDIAFGWGYAEIEIHTHKIGGLHENDFILAAKIDQL